MNTKSKSAFKSISRTKLLSQTAQEEIKDYIVRNALKPGDPLPPEAELAQGLTVSRNSVREAVKSLEALGIVEARAGSGLFVKQFSFDSILDNLGYGLQFDTKQLSDILEVRYHIEYGMIEHVLQVVTDAQIEKLNAILERMRVVAEQGQYSADEDQLFHQVLYENVNNLVVRKILDVFWAIYRNAQKRVAMPQPTNPMATYLRHVAIVRALEAHDLGAMQQAVAQHRIGISTRVRMLEEAQTLQPET